MWKRAAEMVCLHIAVMYRKRMGRPDINGTISQFFQLLDETLLHLCIVTVDHGLKPDQKYARRRDRQKYVGRIK